nr:translation initiation factor IF-2-like [Oryctolagus cuniculus]
MPPKRVCLSSCKRLPTRRAENPACPAQLGRRAWPGIGRVPGKGAGAGSPAESPRQSHRAWGAPRLSEGTRGPQDFKPQAVWGAPAPWRCPATLGAEDSGLAPDPGPQVDGRVLSQLRRASPPPSGQSVKYKFKFRARPGGAPSLPRSPLFSEKTAPTSPPRRGPAEYPRPAPPRPAGAAFSRRRGACPRVPAPLLGATEGSRGSGRGEARSEPVGASPAPQSQRQTALGRTDARAELTEASTVV